MLRSLAGFCVLILSAQAHALGPDDFAFGLKLPLPGPAALYEVSLPQQVYQGVTHPELYDVRVFNRAGEEVPFVFRAPPPVAQTPLPVNLPLFPLPTSAMADPNNIALNIQTDARGAVTGIANANPAPNELAPQYYLIDATALARIPDKLLLVWDAPEQGFTATLSVDYSEDLQHWEILEPEATLAEIGFEGRTFAQREIDLPPVRARYLRLHWTSGVTGVRFSSAQALFAPPQPNTPQQWTPIPGKRVEDSQAQLRNVSVYLFDAGGLFPIDRIRVRLPQDNALVEAVLLSRATAAEPWRERYRGTLYQIQVQALAWQNTNLALFPTTDRYWRLEVDDRNGGLGTGRPLIEIGWIEKSIIFAPQGEAPFILAYGSFGLNSPSALKSLLLNDVESRAALIKPVMPGEVIVLGGEQRQQAPAPGMSGRAKVLWAALLAGLGVLLFMGWRLYRQQKRRTAK